MYSSFFEKITQIYHKLKHTKGGKNASYIKQLSKVDPHLYAISICTVDGYQFNIGDYKNEFAIESCSKVFTLALALEKHNITYLKDKIGAIHSSASFNSVCAIANSKTHTMNSFDNGGAMSTTSLLYDSNKTQFTKEIIGNMSKFAGKKLYVNNKIYESETSQIDHNLSLAYLLKSYKRFYGDVEDCVEVYTKQCSVMVTSHDAAVMAATIANNGINPKTNKRCISKYNIKYVLDHMSLMGLYNQTDEWMREVGLPAKSGVGGIILISIPGIMGISIISPPLNKYGNSVKGIKTAKEITKILFKKNYLLK
jgi:glutaminase